MRVLVIEDEPQMRKLVGVAVKLMDYDVVTAADGVEGLEALADDSISLVLCDWMMPRMDGIEFCRKVRRRDWDRYIYIIMLTALSSRGRLSQALEAGADDFATKPFEEDELQARLHAGSRIVRLERLLANRVDELEELLKTVRQLKELLPICMYCKKIRDDNDYWQQIEEYLHTQTGADFSHGICPDCFEKIVKPTLDELDAEEESVSSESAAVDGPGPV